MYKLKGKHGAKDVYFQPCGFSLRGLNCYYIWTDIKPEKKVIPLSKNIENKLTKN